MDPNAKPEIDENADLSALDRGDKFGDDLSDVLDEPGDVVDDTPPKDEPTKDEPKKDEPTKDEPTKDEPKKEHMIPKSRLDEEIRKRRDLEERVKRLEEGPKKDENPPDPATVPGTQEWFDAKEEAYMDAILEGTPDVAKAIRREIRAEEQRRFEETVEERSRKAVKAVDVQKEFDDAVARLESAFPQFQTEHEEFDEVTVQAIIAAQHTLLKRDPTLMPGAALIQAADKLGYKLDAPAGKEETPPADETADDDDDTPPPAPKSKPAQPPRGATEDRTPAPRSRLTESGVARMSAEDRARARGDFIG